MVDRLTAFLGFALLTSLLGLIVFTIYVQEQRDARMVVEVVFVNGEVSEFSYRPGTDGWSWNRGVFKIDHGQVTIPREQIARVLFHDKAVKEK